MITPQLVAVIIPILMGGGYGVFRMWSEYPKGLDSKLVKASETLKERIAQRLVDMVKHAQRCESTNDVLRGDGNESDRFADVEEAIRKQANFLRAKADLDCTERVGAIAIGLSFLVAVVSALFLGNPDHIVWVIGACVGAAIVQLWAGIAVFAKRVSVEGIADAST